MVRENYQIYTIKIKDWDSYYGFNLKHNINHIVDNSIGPYEETKSITIRGELIYTGNQQKIKKGHPTEITLYTYRLKIFEDTESATSIGYMQKYSNLLKIVTHIPDTAYSDLLNLLSSGKARIMDFTGTELYRSKATIRSLCVNTEFDPEEYKN